jgi:hypothetical protein
VVSLTDVAAQAGGRVCTSADGFDLGASWIHGAEKTNPILALAVEAGAVTLATVADRASVRLRVCVHARFCLQLCMPDLVCRAPVYACMRV